MTRPQLWLVCSSLVWLSACLRPPDAVGALVEDASTETGEASSEDSSTSGSETSGPDDPETDTDTEAETGDPEPSQPCAGDCPCANGEICEQYCDPFNEEFPDPGLSECAFSCGPGSLCLQECGPDTFTPCTSECDGAEACDLQCTLTGGCMMSCVATDSCTVDCSGGCESICVGSSCEMFCPEGDCLMHCIEGQSCRMLGCPFGCTLICENVEDCFSDCIDPSCAVIMS